MAAESPRSEILDTRFSTPAPELDDHRRLHLSPQIEPNFSRDDHRQQPHPSPRIEANSSRDENRHVTHTSPRIDADPSRERQLLQPLARRGSLDHGGLHHVNRAPWDANPAAIRDFEHVIIDDDRSDRGLTGEVRRGSARVRRFTNRQGRSRDPERIDRSRNSSASSSTSPPNSVEAFADPRRRERANTLDSRAPSIVEALGRRTSVASGIRRPSVSNVPRTRAGTHQGDGDDGEEDAGFPNYEEPGKTYKIDFEELEEFVALSAQGLVPGQPTASQKVFHDLRQNAHRAEVPKIVMNCENPLEQVLEQLSSDDSTRNGKNELDEKASIKTLLGKRDRFCLFSTETQSVTYATELGDFTSDGEMTFRDLFELGPDGGVWWLDVVNPTGAELECLRKAFKIHPLTKEDIEQQEAREKVELFSQYYFVCFRSFHHEANSEEFLEAVNIYIIVTAEGVLSFSFSDTPHAKNVRKRINKSRDFVNLGPDYICYALIDDIVDSFAPVIHSAETESENIEDQVFIARDSDYTSLLRHIGESRKNVLSMMRLLGGKADVIKGFAKRCNEQYSVTPRGDIGVYLGDIQDHVVTMMSTLGHIEKMLSRSHSNYLAQLNVEHLLRGNHTNKVLSKITVLATILVPLNLVCGLFGMNVPVPGHDTTSLAWFFGIVGFIAAIVVCSIATARRLKVI